MPRAPSVERVQALAGGAPKYAACEVFGREPGVTGLVGGAKGVPPEWNDKGANDKGGTDGVVATEQASTDVK
jgi:hypothetical protein